MSGFGLRTGGFTGQLDPFGTNTGGFGQYEIGSNGSQLDALRRDSARINWANGVITDEVYVHELEVYWKAQDPKSIAGIQAKSDYQDAVYSIDRNKLVRNVNNAVTSSQRVGALTHLISYDEQRLHAMKADNEQTRQITDRIHDAESQIRDARYSDASRAYNKTHDSNAMLAFVRRMAAASQGATDHSTWQDRIDQWTGQVFTDQFNAAKAVYEKKRTLGNGAAMVGLIQQRLAQMPAGTPAATEMQQLLTDTRTSVDQDHWNARQEDMQRKNDTGQVSNEQYIAFLHERLQHEKDRGNTTALQTAKKTLLTETYRVNQGTMEQRFKDGSASSGDLIAFYQGYATTMDLGADNWRQIQDRILQLRVGSVQDINASGNTLGGHWVTPGKPGSSDVGFASQFDGSEFANQNCMFASGAMMADALGVDGLSGADLRRYSGDGADGGAGYQHMLATAYSSVGLGVNTYNGISYKAFTKRLAQSPGGAVIAGLLASIPEQFRISPNSSGAHSVYITSQTKVVGGETWRWVMDPLGRAGYNGQWWPDQVVQAFGWSGVRNPISGNAIYGNVMFGNRTGKTSGVVYRTPHFQAFDTNAKGESTIGKGGGTSRTEAGPPTDWRRGRVGKTAAEKGGAKDPSDIQKFLAAIDRYSAYSGDEGSNANMTPEQQKQREAIAKQTLDKYKGNARLASIAWFYGDANTDTSTWTQTQRAIANAVGGAMGYPVIPPGGIGVIIPGESQPKAADGAGNVLPQAEAGGPAPEPIPGLEANRQHDPTVDQTDPDYAKAARAILTAAGVANITPDVLRAMVGWIKTDTGKVIEGNNPMGLHTTGNTDLPGQIGRNSDGTAIFGSIEDGVAAASRTLTQDYPGIVAGANSGQAGTFIASVTKSGWNPGYGDALYQAFNAQTGTKTLVGGVSAVFDGSTFGKLAGRDPDLAELANVDPADPAQMGWFEKARTAAKYAFDHGLSTWQFETLSGYTVQETFNPEIYAELSHMKAGFLDAKATMLGKWTPEGIAAQKDAVTAANEANGVSGQLAMDSYDDQQKRLDTLRQSALAGGDLATYANVTLSMYDNARMMLGQGPTDYSGQNQNPILGRSDLDHIHNDIDKLDPDSVTGDPVLKMILDPRLGATVQKDPKTGDITSIGLNPDTMFVEQDAGGKIVVHTILTDPNSFEPPHVLPDANDPTGNTMVNVPPYRDGRLAVTLPSGFTIFQPITGGQVQGATVDYYGLPTTVPTTQTGPSAGVVGGGGNGSSFNTNEGLNQGGSGYFEHPQNPGSILSPGSWMPTIQQNNTLPSKRTTPADGMLVTTSGVIPAQYATYRDQNGKLIEMYSLDGTTWASREHDPLNSKPLTVVLNQNSGLKITSTPQGPTFTDANGKDVSMSDQANVAKYFHILGDPAHPEDTANPDAVPPQIDWNIQKGQPSSGGGVSIDPSSIDTSTVRGRFVQTLYNAKHSSDLTGALALGNMYANARALGAQIAAVKNARDAGQAQFASALGPSGQTKLIQKVSSSGLTPDQENRLQYQYGAPSTFAPPVRQPSTPSTSSAANSAMSQANAARQASIDANARASAENRIRQQAAADRARQQDAARRAAVTPVTTRPTTTAPTATTPHPTPSQGKIPSSVQPRTSGFTPRTTGIGVTAPKEPVHAKNGPLAGGV